MIYSEELIEDLRVYHCLSSDPRPSLTSVWAPNDADLLYEKDTGRRFRWAGARNRWEYQPDGFYWKMSGPVTIAANGATDNVQSFVASCRFPAGLLLENSYVRWSGTWDFTAVGVAKTFFPNWSNQPTGGVGTSWAQVAHSTAGHQSGGPQGQFWCANSLTVQKGPNYNGWAGSGNANALITRSGVVNVAQDCYLNFFVAWNSANAAGETITVHNMTVWVDP